jgi:CBS domain-containing protein
MNKTVASAMTSDPYVVSREASVVEAATIMRDQDVGSVPVVEDDYLLGIVTDRDLALRVVAAGLDPKTTKVEAIATSNLHSAMPDDSLDDVYERMAIWRIRRLPVIESDGKLVGMIAQADLVHELKDKKAGQLVEEISQPGETFYGRQEVGIG